MSASNSQSLEELRKYLMTKQYAEILGCYLKSYKLPEVKKASLSKLFKHAMLVTISCRQTTTFVPSAPFELGIATFDRRSIPKNTPAGPHAENYFIQVWSMHLRLQEYAHLPLDKGDTGNYHFGTSVFASKHEARDFLIQIWNQPMNGEKPELGLRPIICLHWGVIALRPLLDLDFKPGMMDTTITLLDGQVIAEQTKMTIKSYMQVGHLLKTLRIPARDTSNCGNAAIYIIIVAMLSVLRKSLYGAPSNPGFKIGQFGASASKQARQVVAGLADRPTPVPPVGTKVYCCRCGSFEHFLPECPNTDFICDRCSHSSIPWRRENAASHKEGFCIFPN